MARWLPCLACWSLAGGGASSGPAVGQSGEGEFGALPRPSVAQCAQCQCACYRAASTVTSVPAVQAPSLCLFAWGWRLCTAVPLLLLLDPSWLPYSTMYIPRCANFCFAPLVGPPARRFILGKEPFGRSRIRRVRIQFLRACEQLLIKRKPLSVRLQHLALGFIQHLAFGYRTGQSFPTATGCATTARAHFRFSVCRPTYLLPILTSRTHIPSP